MNEAEYRTISKFDRALGSLLAGNNQHTKPTTIEHVEKMTGESETFIVQTIRPEGGGDHVALKFVDRDGVVRMILPSRVVETIVRQRDSLTTKVRSVQGKARAKELLSDPEKRAAMVERLAKGRKHRKAS